MKSVIVLAEAAEDLELGRDFYEAIAPGIGEYFIRSLLTDIEGLSSLHGFHPAHFGFPRMLASRFPFGIYYTASSKKIQVFAVLDLRRDPLWIRKKLTDR